jgi:hypothetical protein
MISLITTSTSAPWHPGRSQSIPAKANQALPPGENSCLIMNYSRWVWVPARLQTKRATRRRAATKPQIDPKIGQSSGWIVSKKARRSERRKTLMLLRLRIDFDFWASTLWFSISAMDVSSAL